MFELSGCFAFFLPDLFPDVREEPRDLLRPFLSEDDCAQDVLLRQLVRAGLDHDDPLGRRREEEIQIRFLARLPGGVENELPADHPDAHGPERAVRGAIGERDGEARRVRRRDVMFVLVIVTQDRAKHLDVVPDGLGEHRPQSPVNHAREQDVLVGRSALALAEPRSRDLAARVVLLLIDDLEREEINPLARRGAQGDVAHAHGLARLAEDGRVRLVSEHTGPDDERLVAEIQREVSLRLERSLRCGHTGEWKGIGHSFPPTRHTYWYGFTFQPPNGGSSNANPTASERRWREGTGVTIPLRRDLRKE